MDYKRTYYSTILGRLSEPRHFIQVLAGPRQVGKTTIIRQVLSEIKIPYISMTADGVPESEANWISNLWEKARMKMDFNNHSEYLLVIDEIQKLPNWSEIVKKEWDADTFAGRNLKVLLSGSSRLLLKKGLTESLAGRFELIRMGHWSYAEMREAFGWTLNQYIYFGGYPGCADMIGDEDRWKNYVRDALVESAISKDVLLTTTIYKPALLRQLFELGCSYSSKILSLNKMIGQLTDAGNVTTLSNYLQILDECNLLCGLQKYAVDTARKYSSMPKYQVYNPALHTIYVGRSFEKECTDPKQWGRWVETAVGAYLLNNADKVGYRLYYWREQNEEVDFILTKWGKTVAIEVKSGQRTANSGLQVFRAKYKPYRAFVVGGEGFSVGDFLNLDLNLLFD